MDSAKPTLAVALADERLGKGWRRPQTRIRVVAVLSAVVAAAIVFGLFNRFRVPAAEAKPERQLIGTVDLRIGNPAVAMERGEAQARADIEAGLLQLQVFGPTPAKADTARDKQLKDRYGFAWVHKGATATPFSQAWADSYNHAMQAEIERRHGREVAERLKRELAAASPRQDKKEGA